MKEFKDTAIQLINEGRYLFERCDIYDTNLVYFHFITTDKHTFYDDVEFNKYDSIEILNHLLEKKRNELKYLKEMYLKVKNLGLVKEGIPDSLKKEYGVE